MDYAKGYKDYIEEIRNDAAISGTDANYEFVRRTFAMILILHYHFLIFF